MARIAGIDLPRTKRVEIGLTYIYGIGRKRSNDILTEAGVSPDIRVKDLSEDDVRKISRVIEEQGRVEGDLRKEISMNIKRLMEIGSWRGHAASPQPAGPRPAHAHQRAHAQGPPQGCGGEEEDGIALSCQLPAASSSGASRGSSWKREAGSWKLRIWQKRPD